MKEGRIEDVDRAREMAYAGKFFRERAIVNDNPADDRRAHEREEAAGEEYDRQKRAEKIAEGQKEQENTEVSLDNFKVENLTENLRRLGRIFQEREQDRMSALIEPDSISKLRAICSNLEESTQKKDLEELKNNLRRLSQIFEEVGRVPNRGPVRDDSENLSKIIRGIQATHDQILDMKSEKLGEELNKIINKLLSVSQDSWNILAKKREVLKRYEGRRY